MRKSVAILLLVLWSVPLFAFDANTIVSAKRAIKDNLKDPKSVIFEDVFYSYTEKGGGIACGRFNAKNSLGGYTGFKRFISNGKSTFIEGANDTNPPFPKLWNMICHR